jgi:hypothetical protein
VRDRLSLSLISNETRIPEMSVSEFFATEPLRLSIACFSGRLSEHAAALHEDVGNLRRQINGLVAWGLATRESRGMQSKSLELTERGRASLAWNAPPPTPGVSEKEWARDLAHGIAEKHGVTVYDMLKGRKPAALARLCFALLDRDWTPMRIALHFGVSADKVSEYDRDWAPPRAPEPIVRLKLASVLEPEVRTCHTCGAAATVSSSENSRKNGYKAYCLKCSPHFARKARGRQATTSPAYRPKSRSATERPLRHGERSLSFDGRPAPSVPGMVGARFKRVSGDWYEVLRESATELDRWVVRTSGGALASVRGPVLREMERA